MSVFSDAATYRYSGMYHYKYRHVSTGPGSRATAEANTPMPIPAGTLVSPMYITYDDFCALPKRSPYRAIFVMRDPRDLLTSWYFSAMDNHILQRRPDRPLYKAREKLRELSEEEGLLFAVDYWRDSGRFEVLESWAEGAPKDDSVMLVRYEDLVGAGGQEGFRRIFEFFDINLPDEELRALVDAYSFKRLSGRMPGTADNRSHLRSGRAGDWEKHFTPAVHDRVEEELGDLIERLGYASSQ